MPVSILSLGDDAITISFGDVIAVETNLQVVRLYNYFKTFPVAGVKDIIPAYASLTIVYDILKVKKMHYASAFDNLRHEVEKGLQHLVDTEMPKTKTLHIPVCYDLSLGLDLLEMADEKRISVEEIIARHCSRTYRVFMIGFLPGFAYMGTVDAKIATPRKATPRQQIAAGSIGIADAQTGIYPFNSPGGWNIIGQTPGPIFYPHLPDPCLFNPGDKVQFIPITINEYEKLRS
jgi:inhibitor of KinA